MKLVINRCYGGFGLSPKAIARYAELKGKKAYFFTGGIGSRPLQSVTAEEITGSLFWSAFSTPEHPKSSDNWHDMSLEERQADNARYNAVSLSQSLEDRADPHLVMVVEELGKDASGSCAELEVIEIPDGTQYEIDEYDGMESVHETHRSWP